MATPYISPQANKIFSLLNFESVIANLVSFEIHAFIFVTVLTIAKAST